MVGGYLIQNIVNNHKIEKVKKFGNEFLLLYSSFKYFDLDNQSPMSIGLNSVCSDRLNLIIRKNEYFRAIENIRYAGRDSLVAGYDATPLAPSELHFVPHSLQLTHLCQDSIFSSNFETAVALDRFLSSTDS